MTNWAIVVGINDYPVHSGLPSLAGPVADACDFVEWALHPAGGQVPKENLLFWTYQDPPSQPDPPPSPPHPLLLEYLAVPIWARANKREGTDFNRAPTFADLVAAAECVAGWARDEALMEGGRPRCYVFLAGHGVQARIFGTSSQQTCYLAGDYVPAGIAIGVLPAEEFRNALQLMGFEEVFMFLDCCRVDMAQLNAKVAPIGLPDAEYPDEASWSIGYATRKSRTAWETPDPYPTRGAYSKIMIEGLRIVRDGSGRLTVGALDDYVRNRISSAVHPREQHPYFTGEPSLNELVLSVGAPIPLPARAVGIGLAHLPQGTVVQLKGSDGQMLDSFVAATIPAQAYLVVGQMYSLETPGRSHVNAFLYGGEDMIDA